MEAPPPPGYLSNRTYDTTVEYRYEVLIVSNNVLQNSVKVSNMSEIVILGAQLTNFQGQENVLAARQRYRQMRNGTALRMQCAHEVDHDGT
jgi:hypothetical protein